jgi:hypothetical protein
MPGRMTSIKNGADLSARYREIFNKGFDGVKCFGERYNDPRYPSPDNAYFEPALDPDKPKVGYFECFDTKGYQFLYVFENTTRGWRFVRLAKYAYDEGS